MFVITNSFLKKVKLCSSDYAIIDVNKTNLHSGKLSLDLLIHYI